MTRLDARPTGDQGVGDSIPAGSATFFLGVMVPTVPLIQEGQVSVSGERMCTILVNRLED